MVTLVGVISAHMFLNLKIPEPWPSLAGVGVATLLGLISGLATTRFRIPAFMATLAMSLIASGLATWISQGRPYFQKRIRGSSRGVGSGWAAGWPTT